MNIRHSSTSALRAPPVVGAVVGALITAVMVSLGWHIPVSRAQDVATNGDPAPGALGAAATLYLPAVLKPSGIDRPTPPSGALDQSPNMYLAWRFTDVSLPDPKFTVLLDPEDPTPQTPVAQSTTSTLLDPYTFEPGTTYYWQVIAVGSNGRNAIGPVWSFRTEAIVQPTPGVMVTIPGGEFRMGCDPANPGPSYTCMGKDEPLHTVWLDAYALDKFEVTNGEYAACVQAGACQRPRKSSSHTREDYFGNPAYHLFPVLYVSRDDGIDFCAWAGKRLPTEAEWEKAARGPVDTRPFPWGSEYPDCTRQNRPNDKLCPDNPNDTSKIGQFPRGASLYGVYDLGANVFEWVQDRYNVDWYRYTPNRNPVNLNDGPGDFYVIRGGSYRDRIAYTRTFHRHFGHHGDTVGGDSPYYRSDRVGFRCARSLP